MQFNVNLISYPLMIINRRKFIVNSLAALSGTTVLPTYGHFSPGEHLINNTGDIEIPDNYELLWNDEFNKSDIDSNKWQSTESGLWRAGNVFLKDGCLQLRASMTGLEDQQRFGGEVGRSGKNFLKVEPPARIEIRFKPVMKPGSFLALWAMSNNYPPTHSFEQNTWNINAFDSYNMGVRKEFDFLECAGGENTFNHNSMQIKARMAVHSWINPTPENPTNQTSAQINSSEMIDVGNPVRSQEIRVDWDNETCSGGNEIRYYWREGGKEWGNPRFVVRPEPDFFPHNHPMNSIAFKDITRVNILQKLWNEPIRIILWNKARRSGSWLSQERLTEQNRKTWGKNIPDLNDFPVDFPVDYVRVFVPKRKREGG
jgi:hypothetical protein